ncbi:MAG: hypothetical protein ACKV2T_00420 [Kofleriaceae bacterium]
MSLASALEHVFGLSAGKLDHASTIQAKALEHNPSTWNGDSSSCATWVTYLGREDVLELAIAQRHSTPVVANLFHLFVDAILAAVPFRHEAFLVEIRAPHRLWYFAERWSLAANDLFVDKPRLYPAELPDDPFRRRRSRASWIFYLFPNSATWIDTKDVVQRWTKDGSPTRDDILESWDPEHGCADTLGALWGGYFTGATVGSLAPLLATADSHASAAVRSSASLVRELDRGAAGPMHDDIRSRRARFLDAIRSAKP